MIRIKICKDMKAGFKTSRIAVKPPLGVGQWHQITDEVKNVINNLMLIKFCKT